MAENGRPTTPPRQTRSAAQKAPLPPTPEQVRRMEEARLKSKARAQQQQEASRKQIGSASNERYPAAVAGTKRSHSSISTSVPRTVRNAAATPGPAGTSRQADISHGLGAAPDSGIRAARKFQKYVEYDFSKMTDTKGGFMTQEDDPHNKALHKNDEEDGKPANLTMQEWERMQLQRRLRQQRAGPYEPGLSVMDKATTTKKCRDCGSLEIDWQWDEVLNTQVCNACKEKFPERYSLLTKTEAKEDYLLTDPELRDPDLLPHLEKPNPHKSTWNNMMLYLRYQVEEYAFSEKKWGSSEGLDQEWERRQQETKARKEKKFRSKLDELKKRTRVDAYKRGRAGGGGEFGDTIGKGRHEHEWGRAVEDPESGMMKKRCIECSMEVEEMEL
ncbi:DNA repair protein RAD14 [Polychaeton citri CBS 116435]|uniref:DNA repair protein RAD14 n=1 Tax=Polychaeton citri CBS 116435 TaxID=1314669 RepID=A0A9P4UQ50_9PEZI|nr:DNA repair protein RAD14 [Polychaeton citri CBS 116435]